VNRDMGMMLALLREKAPLVHIITNSVSAHLVASAVLATGALPIMARDSAEVEEVVEKADALVLNTGTPSKERLQSMLLAGRAAMRAGVPVVLDPVGVGFSEFRSRCVHELLSAIQVDVLRGNVSEVAAVAQMGGVPRGVHVSEQILDGRDVASSAAIRLGSIVAVTGEVDYVSDSTRIAAISGGHGLISRVSGAGCASSALIGAFLGVNTDDKLGACVSALSLSKSAAARAVARSSGAGSLMTRWIDELQMMEPEALAGSTAVEWGDVS